MYSVLQTFTSDFGEEGFYISEISCSTNKQLKTCVANVGGGSKLSNQMLHKVMTFSVEYHHQNTATLEILTSS